jgi:hypothetical protein
MRYYLAIEILAHNLCIVLCGYLYLHTQYLIAQTVGWKLL